LRSSAATTAWNHAYRKEEEKELVMKEGVKTAINK